MTNPIATSVTLSGFTRLFHNDLTAVVRCARAADDAGVTQIMLPDHVVMGSRPDRYPFGTFPYGPEEPWPEPLMLCAAMASATERVRLGTGILILPLRPPVLVAKMVATLDQLSNGRVDFGVGSGWQREEFAALGVPYDERVQRLEDGVRACQALWSSPGPVSFAAPTLSFTDIWCEPRPVQDPIPVLFAGSATRATVRRIAAYGDGWLPINVVPDAELASAIAALRAAFTEAGRDPAGLEVRGALPIVMDGAGAADWGATRARAEELTALGVTSVSFGLGRDLRDGADVEALLRSIGSTFA